MMVHAAVLHEHGAAPRFGDFERPAARGRRRRGRGRRRGAPPPRPAQGVRHLLHGPAAAALGGRDGRRRPARRRAARLLRRDRARRTARWPSGRSRPRTRCSTSPTASTTPSPRRWATPAWARGWRSLALRAAARARRCSCSARRRVRLARRAGREAARRGPRRRGGAPGDRLERLRERGADAVVELGARTTSPRRSGRRPAAARRDHRHPVGRAGAGRDAGRRPARAATSRSASSPARRSPCPRRRSAPSRSTSAASRIAHPPVDVRREGYLRLTRHVARGRYRRRGRARPARARSGRLGAPAQAPGRGEARPRFLDRGTGRLGSGAGQPEGEEPS